MTEQDKAKTEATQTTAAKAPTEKKPAEKNPAEKQPTAQDATTTDGRGAGMAPVLAVLALLIAIGTAAGGYYLWTQQQADSGLRQEALQAMAAQAAGLKQDLQASLTEQNQRLEVLLQAEQSARAELAKALEQLHTELGRDRNAWALAEVRYYLRLANTRLLLLGDVASALRAMELADARVTALASPALHKLRALLSEEIAALKAVPEVDIEGASLSLIALAKQVEALPTIMPTRSEKETVQAGAKAAADIKDWRAHAAAIWAEMKTLVTIRRTDRPIDALLAPEQMVFLRHNLRLKLEAARLALLQKDTAVYQASLAEVSEWVAAYFNAESTPVKALLEQISKLATLELQPALPDISASLVELERLEAKTSGKQGEPTP
ncbi:uroporphyrinogen-III C-methyltransferase [Sulfuriflexus mobilis]|uniref:uroporphyrinogen-III C-methyltransferase n=1 Tax=Sulfuriflexus mobilis TaxID=1811807 RepID=UPI000F819E0D|nr:uroporphyrinogen-III C-methyltransferase [Sulfuriflexus mobilis]